MSCEEHIYVANAFAALNLPLAPSAAAARDQADKCTRHLAHLIALREHRLACFMQAEARLWMQRADELEHGEVS